MTPEYLKQDNADVLALENLVLKEIIRRQREHKIFVRKFISKLITLVVLTVLGLWFCHQWEIYYINYLAGK